MDERTIQEPQTRKTQATLPKRTEFFNIPPAQKSSTNLKQQNLKSAIDNDPYNQLIDLTQNRIADAKTDYARDVQTGFEMRIRTLTEENRKENDRWEPSERDKKEAREEAEKEAAEKLAENVSSVLQEIVSTYDGVEEVVYKLVIVSGRTKVRRETVLNRVRQATSEAKVLEKVKVEIKVLEEKVKEKAKPAKINEAVELIAQKIEKTAEKLKPKEAEERIKAAEKVRKSIKEPEDKERVSAYIKPVSELRKSYSQVAEKLKDVSVKIQNGELKEGSEVIKALQEAKSKAKKHTGKEIDTLIRESQREGVKLEDIREGISELINKFERRMRAAEIIEANTKDIEKISLKEIEKRLENIKISWRKGMQNLENAAKEVDASAELAPKRDSFIKKINEVFEKIGRIDIAKEVIGKIIKRNLSPKDGTELIWKIVDDEKANPLMKTIRQVADHIGKIGKEQAVALLGDLRKRVKETNNAISDLKDAFVEAQRPGATKEDVIKKLSIAFMGVPNDEYLEKRILGIISGIERIGFDPKRVGKEISGILQVELGRISVLSTAESALSSNNLRRLDKMNALRNFLDELRINSGLLSKVREGTPEPKWLLSIVDELSDRILKTGRQKENEVGKGEIREVAASYLNGAAMLEGLDYVLNDAMHSKYIAWQNETMRTVDNLFRLGRFDLPNESLIDYFSIGAKSADIELKSITFMAVNRYAGFVLLKRGQESRKTIDQLDLIFKVINAIGLKNEKVVKNMLNAAEKISPNGGVNATAFIVMMCNSEVNGIKDYARKIARGLGIRF